MNHLFSRLFISATLIVLLLFVALWQWLQLNHQFSRNQIQQSLHQELANHMAHINPLLSQGITSDAALKEAFHDFMLLGPSFEIYTLAPDGRIIAYDAKAEKIKTRRVDINNISRFLNDDELPILGTDPRSTNTQKIFSASKLVNNDGLHSGYLYVIIGGEDFDSWQALIQAENQPQIWGTTIGFWIVFALLLFVILLRYFTRPIDKLAKELHQLQSSTVTGDLQLLQRIRGGGEISQLSNNINALLTQIHQQQQQVKRQQQAKHDFLLHLSHDLKTPLTALLGYIDTWLILPNNQRDQALIEYAANSGQTLQQLLRQLLELAALENGQIQAQVQTVNLNDLLNDIQRTFSLRAKKLGISLNFEPLNVQAIQTDPQLMRRVLNNLIDNALRYTPKGGQISIHSQYQHDTLWLVVKDTGSGMHQHEVAALQQLSLNLHNNIEQQPPLHVDNVGDEALPQLGVGLAIVKQLLHLLECKIDVKSTQGEGCQFMIELGSH